MKIERKDREKCKGEIDIQAKRLLSCHRLNKNIHCESRRTHTRTSRQHGIKTPYVCNAMNIYACWFATNKNKHFIACYKRTHAQHSLVFVAEYMYIHHAAYHAVENHSYENGFVSIALDISSHLLDASSSIAFRIEYRLRSFIAHTFQCAIYI